MWRESIGQIIVDVQKDFDNKNDAVRSVAQKIYSRLHCSRGNVKES